MVELSTREHALKIVSENPDWNVLDLGCGTDGIKKANVYADVENYTNSYPNKRFVQTQGSETPFKDKEFDFVFSLHIAEHVEDPFLFCKELTRIGKRGLIEVPTPFFDNLVEGNSNPPPHGHVWWVTFDNIKKEIVFKPRLQIVAELALPKDTTFLLPFFRESMVTEIYWENNIELRQEESYYKYVAGNSDPDRIIDLKGKKVPPHVSGWRPSKI
jgi:ubiquinone/menaquinone biosynthesis C-methylase UbiE